MKIYDVDGDTLTVMLSAERIPCLCLIPSHEDGAALTRDNAAQLWPIIRHYAETGELVEVPPEPSAPNAEITLEVTTALAETMIKVADLESKLVEYCQKVGTQGTAIQRAMSRIEHIELCYAPFTPGALESVIARLVALEQQHPHAAPQQDGEPATTAQVADMERCQLVAHLSNGQVEYSDVYASRLGAVSALPGFLNEMSQKGVCVTHVLLGAENDRYSPLIYKGAQPRHMGAT